MFNSVEYVREICQQRKIPVSSLEKECGFANGYLNPKKLKKIPYDRALKIGKYLSIPVEYLMTGIPSVDMFELIEYLCRKNDVTLEQMCTGAGVGLDTISDLKEKKISRLSYADQVAIANYFEISVDVFSEGVFEETLPNEADAQAIAGYHFLQNKKPTAKSGERIEMDDFTYAMQNEAKDLTEMDKQILLSMAKQLSDARKKKNGETQ